MYAQIKRNVRLLVAAAIFLTATVTWTASAQRPNHLDQEIQNEDRIINRMAFPDEPISFTEMVGRNGKLIAGRALSMDDTWLDGLEIKVKNISRKSVKEISLNLLFPNTNPGGMPFGFTVHGTDAQSLKRNPVGLVPPGGEITLRLPDNFHEIVGNPENPTPLDLRKAVISIKSILYDDDTMWAFGGLFQPDPDNSNRWVRTEPIASGDRQPQLVKAAWKGGAKGNCGFVLSFTRGTCNACPNGSPTLQGCLVYRVGISSVPGLYKALDINTICYCQSGNLFYPVTCLDQTIVYCDNSDFSGYQS